MHIFSYTGERNPSIEFRYRKTLFPFNVLHLEAAAVLQREGDWKKCTNLYFKKTPKEVGVY